MSNRRWKVSRSNRVRRFTRAQAQGIGSGVRWLQRRLWPGAPNAKTLVMFAAVPVLVLVLLEVFGVHYWKDGDNTCKSRDLECGLGIHVVGTSLAALLAYYLVFLRREARGARRWRTLARKHPETLFTSLPPLEGLTGEARSNASLVRRPRETGPRLIRWMRRRWRGNSLLESIIARDQLVKELAADLEEVAESRIVVAASGSGKTMVLLKLAERLAERGQVPVPVSLRGKKELNFEKLAREQYGNHADVHHKDEIDHQWRWLRKRNRITVLADELESSRDGLADRVEAIEEAERAGLRLVVTCRTDGLPGGYRRGRITLDPLDRESVVDDLCNRVGPSKHDRERVRAEIKKLVERAEIAETPYYLAIARVLAALGELRNPPQWKDARLFLTETYREAVTDCRVRPDAGLDTKARRSQLDDLEAVAYARLLGARTVQQVEDRIQKLVPDSDVDVPASIAGGVRLGVLVDRYDDHVRFGHPTTVAYFASCFLVKHKDDDRIWKGVFSQVPFTPLLTLALTFANASARDHELSNRTVRQLMNRVARMRESDMVTPNPTSQIGASGQSAVATASSGDGSGREFERLALIAAAADILRFDPSPDTRLCSTVVGSLTRAVVHGHDIAVAQRRVVRTIGKLKTNRTFEVLWSVATKRGDYVLRRAAARAINENGQTALDAITPRIWRIVERAERGLVGGSVGTHNQRDLIEATKAVAWILPSLRSAAHESGSAHLARLDEAQNKLGEIARSVTQDRGVEASVAQGLKSDAVHRPTQAPDGNALDMLRDNELRASFWFARILALQAVTRRCIAADRTARKDPLKVIRQARHDQHPFVRETARLCQRAIRHKSWSRYQWDDVTDIAAGVPHNLVIDATRLAGDIVLALNLNENGRSKARLEFGESNDLPACLAASKDRLEILGSVPRLSSCKFAKDDDPCFCPYLYETSENGAARRELSRTFCRHQRLTARQPPWQPGITVRDLKEFWAGMEDLAQF